VNKLTKLILLKNTDHDLDERVFDPVNQRHGFGFTFLGDSRKEIIAKIVTGCKIRAIVITQIYSIEFSLTTCNTMTFLVLEPHRDLISGFK
jgi:hypothetical protein